MRPSCHLRSVADLDPRDLVARGVTTVLWDVDGTLMPHHASAPDGRVAERWEALLGEPRLRHLIVSNCKEDRYADLSNIFPSAGIVQGYDTQAGFAVRVRLCGRDRWTVDGVTAGRAPDGPCIPVRKPSGRLVRGAIGWAAQNTGAVGEAIVVGDQYLTDIASANLAGVRSVKVRNLWPRSFSLSVRIGQRIEGVLYRLRFGRPVKGWS